MLSKEEIKEYILSTETAKHPLLNEIYAIRDRRKETQDYTIYVDGYISVDVLNKTLKLESDKQKLIDILEKENEEDKDTVKYYEKQRRITDSNFYKKCYQTQIHKANARREVRKHILEIVKGENQVTVE